MGLSGLLAQPSSSPMVMFLQGDHGGLVTSDQEQQKWLDEASTSVKRNAFFKKKALVCFMLVWANSVHRSTSKLRWLLQDEDNLREALRYSAAMLGELRTSQLTPQKYFELYMQTFTELQHLEVYLINTLTQLKQLCGSDPVLTSTRFADVFQGGAQERSPVL